MDVMPDDGLKQKALQELKQIFPQHDERLLMNAVLSTRNFHLSPPDLLSNDFSSFLQLCINEFLVTDGIGKQTSQGCKIDQIVFLSENETGADFDTLASLVTVR